MSYPDDFREGDTGYVVYLRNICNVRVHTTVGNALRAYTGDGDDFALFRVYLTYEEADLMLAMFDVATLV